MTIDYSPQCIGENVGAVSEQLQSMNADSMHEMAVILGHQRTQGLAWISGATLFVQWN